MDIKQHTELPWSVTNGVAGFPDIIAGKEKTEVCGNEGFYTNIEQDYINAHMVCLSVNFHKKLVDALKTVVTPDNNNMEQTDTDIDSARDLLLEIESATAKANSDIIQWVAQASQENDEDE